MRDKKPTERTISNLIKFLASVKINSLPYVCPVSISEIQVKFGVSSRTASALVDLNIIDKEGPRSWKWIERNPDRHMALQILNYLLEKRKQQDLTAISEFSGIADTLKTIADNLTHSLPKKESSIRGLKSAQNNLFGNMQSKQAERVYIAGQIASKAFNDIGFCEHIFSPKTAGQEYAENFIDIKAVCIKCGCTPSPIYDDVKKQILNRNELVIFATDNLLDQLYKK